MDLYEKIQQSENDAKKIEEIFAQSIQDATVGDFQSAINRVHEESSSNLLFAAWFYRLKSSSRDVDPTKPGKINWLAAVVIALITALVFWGISDPDWMIYDYLPVIILFWAPIAAIGGLSFLFLTSREGVKRALIIGTTLLLSVGYVILMSRGLVDWNEEDYLILMIIHIPLLAWISLGYHVLGKKSSSNRRFSFLIKSVEVIITAGLYLMAGVAFGMITMGLFQAIGITLNDVLMRLIIAGGFGLLPVLALATIYDPTNKPEDQDFEQGLSKFIATMMRLLLPLTIVVLVVYLIVIPFRFMEPFNNRDVLIVYNVLLFAIMGLLLGASPIKPETLNEKTRNYLRIGILVVAILTTLVSVYAMSATVYRTFLGGITINRMTIIGWNIINISLLGSLIFFFIRNGKENWVVSIRKVFRYATNAYVLWSVFLLLAIPLLFR